MQGVQDTAEHGDALLGVARIAQLPRLADITLRVSDPRDPIAVGISISTAPRELIALALLRKV